MNGLKRLLRVVLFAALVVLIVAAGCASTEDAQSPRETNQTATPLTEETTTAPPSTAAADVADEADEADEAAVGATAIPLWEFLTDLDREGMEMWSEMVCELRTNWGSDVESYETNLLALTTDSNPNFQVIRDFTFGDDEIVSLANDVIVAKCPEALTG